MEYIKQIEKAIIFIENNLTEIIRVEDVASITGYSCYHFHKVFKAVLGENIGNYIRSRRLNCAAGELIYTDKRILDIALYYQFESQEAFTRAFKNVYKVSPGSYRKNRIDTIIGSKREITSGYLQHIYKGVTLKPSLCQLEDKKIIGIRFQTTLKENKLQEAWVNFSNRVDEIKHSSSDASKYGICEVALDFNIEQFNENSKSSHFIGVEVPSFDEIPYGMSRKTLKGGKYAVFTHRGRVDSLRMTYEYIWGTWLICSGVEIDQREDFELYNERFLGTDYEQSEIEIYIPIK